MIFNCSCNKKDCLSNTYLLFQVEGHQGQTHTHTQSHRMFPLFITCINMEDTHGEEIDHLRAAWSVLGYIQRLTHLVLRALHPSKLQ